MFTLNVKARDIKESNDAIRKSGFIPAVYYGKKEKSTPVAVSMIDFLRAYKEAGESSVVVLKAEDGSELESLIYDVAFNPVNDAPVHADFYVFEKGQKIEVDCPIEYIGVAPAVKELNGILMKVLHELKIEALPKDLPHEINVDVISLVNFESQILAKDIKLPAGVTLMEKPEEVVAFVAEPKEEKEEEATPVDLSKIEVSEKKGKKEEEAVEGEGDKK